MQFSKPDVIWPGHIPFIIPSTTI